MFVKDRHGRTRPVADAYVLQDGESLAVGFMIMDAAPRSHCETSDDLYRRLVIDRVEDAAPATVVITTGRNGPPVVIKDSGPERSADFAQGAAFASQALYERWIGDAWRSSDPAPVDRISDVAKIDPATNMGRMSR